MVQINNLIISFPKIRLYKIHFFKSEKSEKRWSFLKSGAGKNNFTMSACEKKHLHPAWSWVGVLGVGD